MKTTIFKFAMNSQKTECTLYLIYNASVCLPLQKRLPDAMEGLDTEVGNKEFSL
jgi:hypothetical protein